MSQFNYGGLYTATGRFLQRELRRRHMSQQAFADLQFVDVKTVSRWIHGEVHSLDVVVAIADFFGVSVGDVLSDEDGRPFLYKKIKRFRPDILCPFGISFCMLKILLLKKYDEP